MGGPFVVVVVVVVNQVARTPSYVTRARRQMSRMMSPAGSPLTWEPPIGIRRVPFESAIPLLGDVIYILEWLHVGAQKREQ